MTTMLRLFLPVFTFLGSVLFARAEITLYAFQPSAQTAVEALNAREGHEKYTLSSKPLPGKFTPTRSRHELDLSKFPKDAALLRTSVAMVVDKTGAIVDAVAFNFNDQEFADLIAGRISKMVRFVSNNAKKHERALFIFTYNTRSPEPEELVFGPIKGP